MGTRILLVDDQETILFAMHEYFTILGYQVDCARALEEAVTLLSQDCYSAVIADLQLTGVHATEGFELMAHIRQRSPTSRVIILTACGSPAIEREARRRGADAFLPKRLSLYEVTQIMERLLGQEM
jgi:DNA-binding response OmpR family regulator